MGIPRDSGRRDATARSAQRQARMHAKRADILTYRASLGQSLRVLSNKRRAQLLVRLNEEGRASVNALARDLGVTPSTIRRDLARLSVDGALVRTYGGAAAGTAPRPEYDPVATSPVSYTHLTLPTILRV